jgi:iron-sulfur cluster repair protein YtfE (RIC family)
MKRNINLIELSRDHHHGLLMGWKIKQGIKNNVDTSEISKYIQHFFNKALKPHFKQEEEEVLIFLPDSDVLKKQAIDEHFELLNLVAQLSENSTLENLTNVEQQLEKHIRFEERLLFPYLENSLTKDELEKIGIAIAVHHQPYIENYKNEFWKY